MQTLSREQITDLGRSVVANEVGDDVRYEKSRAL